jgi:peptidoglycan/xylan/chitin deacetylase (PgdA/CDA1 family)
MKALTQKNEFSFGGIIRTDSTKKEIHLVFTGHEFGDGGEVIRTVLAKHSAKGAFFLTGDFYRNTMFSSLIRGLKSDGHYLGGHSDKHLLYCLWEKRDSLLVSKEEFTADLHANYAEIEKFGVRKSDAPFFLPPYEWYNNSVSEWTKELGLTLVNFSPGTYSNADWTIPELGKQYLSSDTIYNRILAYERNHSNGLKGFILLTHIGVDPRRTDKFYLRLDGLMTELEKRGYRFTSLREGIQ